ncbi:GNAT family N-acetyltransferase [Dactylosporangium sucinum]|uniref:GNAT family N-acetyltransferase n=1 Tax=Dactylosporangium sucinum TaxID=1424081 RepID=UPI00167EA1BD|nr:GNAT family N-acetyltransferase [Dactylosporangium sucinum]
MIETSRLVLEPLDQDALRAVAGGERTGRAWHAEFPVEDDRDAARMTLRHLDPVFGCLAVVERGSGNAVGTIGFFGPPDERGAVVVGYGLVPSARGQGYATEALRALVRFAFSNDQVRRIEADPDRANRASHRVLEKAGFVRGRADGDAVWYAVERAG